MKTHDLIVVGGGLAGLTAAAFVARAGRTVIVAERASRLGGRATTHDRDGARFNLGPHALYRGGHAFRLMQELRVPFSGRIPNPGRSLFTVGEQVFDAPTGFKALVTSRLLSIREKWQLVRFIGTLRHIDTAPLQRVALGDWIAGCFGDGNLARLLLSLVRVSTYTDDPNRLSAGAALDQLRIGLADNVWYLDGGWQTLIDGLRARAIEHGADIRPSSPVASVRNLETGGVIVRLGDGKELHARTAILAVPPMVAQDLLDLPAEAPLSTWIRSAIPARAACLDVALSSLPRPTIGFALGLDRPYYFSVHSKTAKLAPDGRHVVQLMKYLGTDAATPGPVVEHELETYLDRLQPGWREHVLSKRFLPGMVASNAIPRADEGGLIGRPGSVLAERPNVFLAGDWVGTDGMLADASAASAETAARLALVTIEHDLRRPADVAA